MKYLLNSLVFSRILQPANKTSSQFAEDNLRTSYLRKTSAFVSSRAMSKLVCLADFEAHFLKSLDRNARDYFSSGANQEQTLRDNVEAFYRCVCVCVCVCDVASEGVSPRHAL